MGLIYPIKKAGLHNKEWLEKRWMQPSFEQTQHQYIASSANLHSRQSTAEEKHGAAVYLSAVKSRCSYFVPEVQARLVKAVSIIF